MDGEFVVEESLGVAKGIGGGNVILQAETMDTALAAARRAIETVAPLPGVITPFPGGVVRSGSKVGAKYAQLVASTNDAFCPTLRGLVSSELVEAANCAYELVFDGVDATSIATAIRTSIEAISGDGVLAISAGNYGGKLGKFHFHLHELLQDG